MFRNATRANPKLIGARENPGEQDASGTAGRTFPDQTDRVAIITGATTPGRSASRKPHSALASARGRAVCTRGTQSR